MNLGQQVQFVRSFGLGWVAWRAGYAAYKGSGLLKRRFPTTAFSRVRLADVVRRGTPASPEGYRRFRESSDRPFFFERGRPPDADLLRRVAGAEAGQTAASVANDYCHGRFRFYGRHVRDLGWPPNWLLNPFNGFVHHARTHWCDYPSFTPAAGDVKDVWEPSRFACAFWLARAYAWTGDERYPTAFWKLFESWCAQNPPNLGPNWKCGQETAFRTMAWCFALYAFWNSAATTAERIAAIVKAMALQGRRIAANIGYAISQKNNHAFSEAVGLMTLGLLFPELQGADRWLRLGREVLEREIGRQLYADGSYVQQSMNYHRVMLHDCLWAVRLSELNGQPLPDEVTRRVADAGDFLLQMLDGESGCAPNYGPNDGALVLPLSACDDRDYRPTIQAGRYQATRRRVLAPGPWDEMLVWLYGPEVLAEPPEPVRPVSRRFDAGGYYTLRGRDSWCMVRCHSYRDRPAHVDMLHVELWYKGANVLGDSGTYRYYAPDDPAMERHFKDIGAHNMIELDGRGPLDLVARWVWLPWPRATCLEHRADAWVGEHYAYNRAPWYLVHRRGVQIVDERTWQVTDDLLGHGEHRVTLWWHLADQPVRPVPGCNEVDIAVAGHRVTLSVEAPAGFSTQVYRGHRECERVIGWESAYYGEYTPRPVMAVSGTCVLPARLVTRIRFDRGGGS